MHLAVKALIGVGSVGTLTGVGLDVNHFYSGETIENYLTKINKKNRVFLTSGTNGLSNILTTYESSGRFKPQDDKGNAITKDKLVEWCGVAIKGKYYGSSDKSFKGVESWCYININSFAEQIKNNENKKISEKTHTEKDWTDAWASYQSGRTQEGLKIVDSSRQTALDGAEAVAGAKALHDWCKAKLDIKLYVDNAEEEFNRFDKWCAKVNVN